MTPLNRLIVRLMTGLLKVKHLMRLMRLILYMATRSTRLVWYPLDRWRSPVKVGFKAI